MGVQANPNEGASNSFHQPYNSYEEKTVYYEAQVYSTNLSAGIQPNSHMFVSVPNMTYQPYMPTSSNVAGNWRSECESREIKSSKEYSPLSVPHSNQKDTLSSHIDPKNTTNDAKLKPKIFTVECDVRRELIIPENFEPKIKQERDYTAPLLKTQIGKYTPFERQQRILKFKHKLKHRREKIPCVREHKGKREAALRKNRIKGKFI